MYVRGRIWRAGETGAEKKEEYGLELDLVFKILSFECMIPCEDGTSCLELGF